MDDFFLFPIFFTNCKGGFWARDGESESDRLKPWNQNLKPLSQPPSEQGPFLSAMDLGFVFEAPSDEEPEYEPDEDGEEEEEEEVVVDEANGAAQTASQSPWDFGSYSETVAEEHARRSTTSVDFKISKALERRPVPIANQDDSSESESDHQVHFFLLPLLTLIALYYKLILSV